MTAKKIVREAEGWNPPAWIAVPLSRAYFKAERMPPEECKAWVMETLRGCMTGEREEGSDADRLLRDAAARMAKRSNAGKVAADARWRQGQGCERNANALRTDSERNANGMRNDAITRHDTTNTTIHNRHDTTDTTDRPTARERAGTGFEGGEETGPLAATIAKAIAPATAPEPSKGTAHTLANFQKDPVGYLPNVPAALLPNCAALYCQEGASEMALNGYTRQMRRIGTAAFRDTLDKFVRAGEAGEHAGLEKPGAALMAALKDIPGRIA